VRNSSLVEWRGTDNVSRLKQDTEAMDPSFHERDGRGALCRQRSPIARTGGACTSENAGMSSAMSVTTRHTEGLRVPGHCQSSQGESGPKPRTS
jgi:hypothetical protein